MQCRVVRHRIHIRQVLPGEEHQNASISIDSNRNCRAGTNSMERRHPPRPFLRLCFLRADDGEFRQVRLRDCNNSPRAGDYRYVPKNYEVWRTFDLG